MSKSPPASFTYMARPFEIRMEDDPRRVLHENAAHSSVGVSSPHEGYIAIRAGQTAVEERDTVLHELIHIVLAFGHADNEAHFQDENAEERVVNLLSVGLLAAFWQNPALARYLCASS